MAVGQISLTSSMRQNLLSLQRTQGLMDMTQNRLATGRSVNTALDNAQNFFAAAALTNRANDLDRLMDGMGQAIQTLTAADHTITTLNRFLEQAQASANSARDSQNIASSTLSRVFDTSQAYTTAGTAIAGAVGVDRTAGITGAMHMRSGQADRLTTSGRDFISLDAEIGVMEGFTITVNNVNIAIPGVTTAQASATPPATVRDFLEAAEAAGGGQFTARLTADGDIQFAATGGEALMVALGTAGDGAGVIGIDRGVEFAAFTAGMSIADVVQHINDQQSLTGVRANFDAATNSIRLSGMDGQDFVVQGPGATDATGLFGGAARAAGDVVSVTNGTNNRRVYAEQFDRTLTQINELVQNRDSGYRGTNLAFGDSLQVNFNETRTSTLTLRGAYLDTKGLGVGTSQNEWLTNMDIDKSIAQVERAVNQLRMQASEFAQNLTTVQTRQDFTQNMIETLTTGADKLTLADMNEESANMLALQTRQQLGVNALSLASQSAQSVLRLF